MMRDDLKECPDGRYLQLTLLNSFWVHTLEQSHSHSPLHMIQMKAKAMFERLT